MDGVQNKNYVRRFYNMKNYEELSEDLKAEAKELHPEDYTEWKYQIKGVEIEFSAK